MSSRRLYSIWYNMKRRCYNEDRHNYDSYGGRGIKVCDEWRNSLDNFKNWAITHGYEPWLSLEREDPDGNYTPFNCTWATKSEQCNNRRTNTFVEYDGHRRTVWQWSKALGVSYEALKKRVQKWTPDYKRIFTQPYSKQHKKKRPRKPTSPDKFTF